MVNKLVKTGKLAGYSPFSTAIIYGWIAFGILAIISFFIKQTNPDITLQYVPPILELFSGIFIIAGSILMLISGRFKNLLLAWNIDKAGMTLALGGWVSQFIGLSSADFTKVGGELICLISIAALIARFAVNYTYARYIKTKVDKLWSNGLIHKP